MSACTSSRSENSSASKSAENPRLYWAFRVGHLEINFRPYIVARPIGNFHDGPHSLALKLRETPLPDTESLLRHRSLRTSIGVYVSPALTPMQSSRPYYPDMDSSSLASEGTHTRPACRYPTPLTSTGKTYMEYEPPADASVPGRPEADHSSRCSLNSSWVCTPGSARSSLHTPSPAGGRHCNSRSGEATTRCLNLSTLTPSAALARARRARRLEFTASMSSRNLIRHAGISASTWSRVSGVTV